MAIIKIIMLIFMYEGKRKGRSILKVLSSKAGKTPGKQPESVVEKKEKSKILRRVKKRKKPEDILKEAHNRGEDIQMKITRSLLKILSQVNELRYIEQDIAKLIAENPELSSKPHALSLAHENGIFDFVLNDFQRLPVHIYKHFEKRWRRLRKEFYVR